MGSEKIVESPFFSTADKRPGPTSDLKWILFSPAPLLSPCSSHHISHRAAARDGLPLFLLVLLPLHRESSAECMNLPVTPAPAPPRGEPSPASLCSLEKDSHPEHSLARCSSYPGLVFSIFVLFYLFLKPFNNC